MTVLLLIVLGGVFGLVGAMIATSDLYPGPVVLLVSVIGPPAVMYVGAISIRLGWRRRRRRRLRPVTTGREVIVCIIVIVATVVVGAGVYGNQNQRPRIVRAQADSRALVSAVSTYRIATGRFPDTLADLTRPVRINGHEAGPYMSTVPAPPRGWLPYRYEQHGDGTFTIHSRAVDGEVRVRGPVAIRPRLQ